MNLSNQKQQQQLQNSNQSSKQQIEKKSQVKIQIIKHPLQNKDNISQLKIQKQRIKLKRNAEWYQLNEQIDNNNQNTQNLQGNEQQIYKNDSKNAKNQYLTILVVTWNLGGTLPSEEEIYSKLINIEHDLIIIGSQECSRSIFKSFFYENKSKWENNIKNVLDNTHRVITQQSMNALHIIAFASKNIYKYIYNIATDCIKAGILNLVGNKGAVAISFDIDKEKLIFINCHLASGQDKYEQRNKDLQRISKLKIPFEQNKNKSSSLLTERFDHIFWFGDLNYRIKGSGYQKIMDNLQDQNIQPLLQQDQLIQNKQNIPEFCTLNEGLIQFMPTYKIKIDKNNQQKYNEKRLPAWTDRILFQSNFNEQQQQQQCQNNSSDDQLNPNIIPVDNQNENNQDQNSTRKRSDAIILQQGINLINYECNTDVLGQSDHKPVFSQFILKRINSNILEEQIDNPKFIDQPRGCCCIF